MTLSHEHWQKASSFPLELHSVMNPLRSSSRAAGLLAATLPGAFFSSPPPASSASLLADSVAALSPASSLALEESFGGGVDPPQAMSDNAKITGLERKTWCITRLSQIVCSAARKMCAFLFSSLTSGMSRRDGKLRSGRACPLHGTCVNAAGAFPAAFCSQVPIGALACSMLGGPARRETTHIRIRKWRFS